MMNDKHPNPDLKKNQTHFLPNIICSHGLDPKCSVSFLSLTSKDFITSSASCRQAGLEQELTLDDDGGKNIETFRKHPKMLTESHHVGNLSDYFFPNVPPVRQFRQLNTLR